MEIKIPKEWEKVDESKRVGYVHFAWKTGKSVNLSLNRMNFHTWKVTHFPGSDKTKFFKKEFKSKSEALIFAEQWMNKHLRIPSRVITK